MGFEGCVEACHPSNVRGNRKELWRERNIRKGKRDELFWGSPGWLRLQRICLQCRRCRRHRFDPWVRKIPGGGNSSPLQFFCLENSMDREAWQATVCGVTKSQTWLSMHASEQSI